MRVRRGEERAAAAWAAAILLRGGLLVLPTDTVYGVAAHPDCPDAVGRLYEVKKRDPMKPIALLAAGPDAVAGAGAQLGARGRELAARHWPGPLTLVLDTPGGREGFRVPDCAITLSVLRACGGLLRVSSANRSGQPDALSAGEARRALGGGIEGVLDGGPVTGGVPSTVLHVDGDRVTVIREGALAATQCLDP
jgi:L-threonylcarbamoyladenylate synthase